MNKLEAILLVDDEPTVIDSIKLNLEAEGYTVITANDGYKALEVLETTTVDIILSDVAMPKLNGYQLYDRISKNPALVSIPFVFLTVRAFDSDIRFGKQLGVDDYLPKPVDLDDLLATIEGKLRRSRERVRKN